MRSALLFGIAWTLFLIVLTVFMAGCSSPTAPTAEREKAPVATSGTPAPWPPPTVEPPPLPVPSPPPVPAPPVPGPAPREQFEIYVAKIEHEHWYGPRVLHFPTFLIVKHLGAEPRIEIGNLELPVVLDEPRNWIAKDANTTFVVSGDSWAFNGIAGQAWGNIR